MKRILYYAVLILLFGALIFSAWKIGSYLLERSRSTKVTEAAQAYTRPVSGETAPGTEPECIEVDFDTLCGQYPNVIGWLYGADTGLNYPIVQGSDNTYYLSHLLDGTSNSNGTLFIDAGAASDFSQPNTAVYGHNMKSGNMFGHLVRYKDPAFYQAHPYLYLMTPSQTYRLDLLAGWVTEDDAPVFSTVLSPEYVAACMGRSTFSTGRDGADADHFLTLSTCSYEYDNARFVVLADMVPVE
jgi:sortase B